MMNLSHESWDSDRIVDQLISQYDETGMPLPDIECQPHLLISKVRKHYMEYLIKLLAVNYETHQNLLNKNIYLPSAIWRCAKKIETAAAQRCMVVQLYRQNLLAVANELKNDTIIGRLHKSLYDCLRTPPLNEKKMQTTINLTEDCTCECQCKKKKRRKVSQSSNASQVTKHILASEVTIKDNISVSQYEQNYIPVLINSRVEQSVKNQDFRVSSSSSTSKRETMQNQSQSSIINSARMSVEPQESDELMAQLGKLFQADPNDDLFEGSYSNNFDGPDTNKKLQIENVSESCAAIDTGSTGDSILQNQPIQTISLDERLASMTGLLQATNTESNFITPAKPDMPKTRKTNCNKWLCEEIYLKIRLSELLDEIRDSNRKKLIRIKESIKQIFGYDSDDDGALSPIEETPEFVTSCKERIAPWVVKMLTPYYVKGRIRGKSLFKILAKHLIRVIYQCNHFPSEYEVKSFVLNFLGSHKMIRCEADFINFRAESLEV